MRTVLSIAVVLLALVLAPPAGARTKSLIGPTRRTSSGITRPKGVTKYYQKENRPRKGATRGPKHKYQNYDQHGWY
jgi:hypothetical protein